MRGLPLSRSSRHTRANRECRGQAAPDECPCCLWAQYPDEPNEFSRDSSALCVALASGREYRASADLVGGAAHVSPLHGDQFLGTWSCLWFTAESVGGTGWVRRLYRGNSGDHCHRGPDGDGYLGHPSCVDI